MGVRIEKLVKKEIFQRLDQKPNRGPYYTPPYTNLLLYVYLVTRGVFMRNICFK